MKLLMNLPIYDDCINEYDGSIDGVVRAECKRLGLDGLEIIWGETEYSLEPPPPDLVVGYHLIFWTDWVDFWHGNFTRLKKNA